MIAYCWASGLIQFGRTVPDGAIEVARGQARPLRDVVGARARHGKGKSAGLLLVPGVPEADDQVEAGDALAAWLKWCSEHPRLGVVFNKAQERACRECGCTELQACPGGCWWVEGDLCSSCAPPMTKARAVKITGGRQHAHG